MSSNGADDDIILHVELLLGGGERDLHINLLKNKIKKSDRTSEDDTNLGWPHIILFPKVLHCIGGNNIMIKKWFYTHITSDKKNLSNYVDV